MVITCLAKHEKYEWKHWLQNKGTYNFVETNLKTCVSQQVLIFSASANESQDEICKILSSC